MMTRKIIAAESKFQKVKSKLCEKLLRLLPIVTKSSVQNKVYYRD